MADDYARHALSQRRAFEATFPAALRAARSFADEPTLCVADLGAADGVNSHGLIRDLIAERAGRPLIYALVDLPTNAWSVAAEHLRRAFGERAPDIVITPGPMDAERGAVDVGSGLHWASAEAHSAACRQALARTSAPATVISLAGIPLQQAPCMPPGAVHVAVSGTAMHWIAESAGLASTGSVFPGYPDHTDQSERRAWMVAAAGQWERLLEMRGIELAPGGRLIAALPASPDPDPDRSGLYVELIGDMDRILADWCRAGRIGAATAAAAVVPVWMRTVEEIRAPFAAHGGRFAGLQLEGDDLFWLENPYWDNDPVAFARDYVKSVTAWGEPLLLRAFALEGAENARGLLTEFLAALEERVAASPDRFRRDYVEALIRCQRIE